jgi:4-aminobutyrate aminotransferase/(S)-3-amino-2-methylpropionate transaminase
LAFEGAYHGLSLGALSVTHNLKFRKPFEARLPNTTRFARFNDIDSVEATMSSMDEKPSAILVEPVQGRGGENVPEPGFLPFLRNLCDKHEVLLIADEIYTGFGRTGTFFACDLERVVPDLLCVGKGMASGMPISACIGRESVMNSWPESKGEALHTQTFLGHPPGCAAALASIEITEELNLSEQAKELGNTALKFLRNKLSDNPKVVEIRGLGLMIGVECQDSSTAQTAVQECLRQGVILLPSGAKGTVLSITPPLNISSELFFLALTTVVACLEDPE